MQPEQLKEEKSISKTFEKLERDMDQLRAILERLPDKSGVEKTANQTEQVKNNVEFMKTLNDISPYLQLPVRLQDKNIHSELYVFTRKKGKLDAKESLRVLLHLDMDHLGPLDIYLQLNRSQIQAKFCVEDDEVKQLFLETSEQLRKPLEEAGYQLSMECIRQEEEKNPIEQIKSEAQFGETSGIKRYSFDIRA